MRTNGIAAVVLTALVMTLAPATRARAEGAGLQVLEMGTGPTVVFVPNVGFSRTDWLPTVKRLKDRYHCVMVELPGQGASPMPDPFSLQAATGLLDAVVAKQNPDSTILVGDGFGAILGTLEGSANPTHLRGVVLINTLIRSGVPDQEREMVVRNLDAYFPMLMQQAFSKAGRDSSESAQIYARISAIPPATLKTYIREQITLDISRETKALALPYDVLYTDKAWKPGTSWGTLAKQLGWDDTTRVVARRIGNAGPLFMKEQPDTLAAMIDRFATRVFAAKK